MADHPLFPVSVVTPEGPAFEGEAEMLIVPGQAGDVLPTGQSSGCVRIWLGVAST